MKQLLSGAVVLLLLAACESERSRASTDSFFTDISLNVGLDFVHEAGEDSSFHMPEIGGAGVAFLDFDNDGDLDIYLVNGGFHADPSRRVANRLYRQDDGRLIDVTAESGLGDTGYGMGVAVGDIDNDGFVDVYVSNHGLDALYRNLGNGSFADITTHAGIANPHWSSSVVMFDFNRDGLLDIYVTNYLRLDASVTCPDLAGRPDYCGPASFDGLPDVLYENLGDARFADVSVASGIAAPASKGLGVVSADFNGDLYPDLYVANDGEANHVWLNSGAGTFSDAAPRLGAAVNGLGLPEAGMGVALGDLEDDGDYDLFVSHFRGETNTLYRAVEHGYRDETNAAGLGAVGRPQTGFGTGFFDFDNDGDLDVVVVNGGVARGPMSTIDPNDYWRAYSEPNFLFENTEETGARAGAHFTDISALAPQLTAQIANSRGLAFGDFDNDGRVDLLVTNGGGRARLLRNTAAAGHWLLVKMLDPALRRDAYGATIAATVGSRTMRRLVAPGYSYQSSNDPRVHFGLGESTVVDELAVTWPDGTVERYTNVAADQIVVLTKGIGMASNE